MQSLSDSKLGHLAKVIRMIVETQQLLALQQKWAAPLQDRSRILGAIRIQKFAANPNTPVRVYREWRKSIAVVQSPTS